DRQAGRLFRSASGRAARGSKLPAASEQVQILEAVFRWLERSSASNGLLRLFASLVGMQSASGEMITDGFSTDRLSTQDAHHKEYE
ncbi:MAG: hypothetical protein ABI835_11470, partial [Chloroflexota bacterium]